ncbi:hypothetical protein BHS06_19275 [Myxococcus xanthus]|nr:hypothetical protein BHS06_19275 [Myxococcus xanthus]
MGAIMGLTERFGPDQRFWRCRSSRKPTIEFDGGVTCNILITQDMSIFNGAALHDEQATGPRIVKFNMVLRCQFDTSNQVIDFIELWTQLLLGFQRGHRIGFI